MKRRGDGERGEREAERMLCCLPPPQCHVCLAPAHIPPPSAAKANVPACQLLQVPSANTSNSERSVRRPPVCHPQGWSTNDIEQQDNTHCCAARSGADRHARDKRHPHPHQLRRTVVLHTHARIQEQDNIRPIPTGYINVVGSTHRPLLARLHTQACVGRPRAPATQAQAAPKGDGMAALLLLLCCLGPERRELPSTMGLSACVCACVWHV